jgi:hypothetical protein
MDDDERQLIELDARGRASLGRIASHRLYLATVHSDGTIVLSPAVALPAAEVERMATSDR